VYGDDRACVLDPVTGCTFLIGPSVVAHAAVPEASLAAVVAAWVFARVSLAALANCTSDLDVLPHAHLLERGETTAWHWANVLYWARAGHEHTDLLPLLERLRPEIRRFYSFTGMGQLIFAYNSRGPYNREGLPSVVPADSGRFTIMLGRDRWTDAAAETEQRLCFSSAGMGHARAPGTRFHGGQADLDVLAIDQELARQGSPLRAYIHQYRRTFSARVVAGPRACQITTDDGWCIHFHDHTGERGWQYYDDAASAIATLRSWLERGEDVELHAIRPRV
jgi:hypothetical protein